MAGASSVQFGAYMTFPQFGDGQESNVWFANDAWNVPTLTIRSY